MQTVLNYLNELLGLDFNIGVTGLLTCLTIYFSVDNLLALSTQKELLNSLQNKKSRNHFRTKRTLKLLVKVIDTRHNYPTWTTIMAAVLIIVFADRGFTKINNGISLLASLFSIITYILMARRNNRISKLINQHIGEEHDD